MSNWYPPVYEGEAFHCLFCQVYAEQSWSYTNDESDGTYLSITDRYLQASQCTHCSERTLWLDQEIIFPTTGDFPPANPDLPDEVKKTYDEAAAIAQQSPRSACALLRLAVEKLLNHLGYKGSINDMIGKLVKKGLDPTIQQALDTLRVTGNEAVHPGVIDFDDRTVVQPLFEMINIIGDALITQPKRIQETYDRLLPEPAKEAISRRDKGTP